MYRNVQPNNYITKTLDFSTHWHWKWNPVNIWHLLSCLLTFWWGYQLYLIVRWTPCSSKFYMYNKRVKYRSKFEYFSQIFAGRIDSTGIIQYLSKTGCPQGISKHVQNIFSHCLDSVILKSDFLFRVWCSQGEVSERLQASLRLEKLI